MVLHSASPEFLQNMYGNNPINDDHLSGIERLRCIINYLTRMRLLCRWQLDFAYKGKLADKLARRLFNKTARANAKEKLSLSLGCAWRQNSK